MHMKSSLLQNGTHTFSIDMLAAKKPNWLNNLLSWDLSLAVG